MLPEREQNNKYTMRRTGYSKLIFTWMAGFCFFFTLISNAQTENVQPKFKQVFVNIPKIKVSKKPQKNNTLVIDSLVNVIHVYDSIYQNQLFQSRLKDSIIDQLNQKILNQQPSVKDLQLRVSEYHALNVQTEKNNFILLVFNSIVCLVLFFMFTRYLLKFRRKKKSVPEKPATGSLKEITQPYYAAEQSKIGHHLEQLEKLGKLRNAGILSEEEFIFQKQLILGNSG
jgi:hypothetical protein